MGPQLCISDKFGCCWSRQCNLRTTALGCSWWSHSSLHWKARFLWSQFCSHSQVSFTSPERYLPKPRPSTASLCTGSQTMGQAHTIIIVRSIGDFEIKVFFRLTENSLPFPLSQPLRFDIFMKTESSIGISSQKTSCCSKESKEWVALLGLGRSWGLAQGGCSGGEETSFACLFMSAFPWVYGSAFWFEAKFGKNLSLSNWGKFEWITLLIGQIAGIW